MAKKLVVRDDVYTRLAQMRGKGENFNDLLVELMDSRGMSEEEVLEYLASLDQRISVAVKKGIKDVRELVEKERKEFEKQDLMDYLGSLDQKVRAEVQLLRKKILGKKRGPLEKKPHPVAKRKERALRKRISKT